MTTVPPDAAHAATIQFDFQPTIRVRFGPGTLAELGKAANELGGSRVLLVTDPGLRAAGHEANAIARLEETGLKVFTFDQVEENPTTRVVEACTAFARDAGDIDLIVGLGGGSSMDCAKGANFLLSNGGQMQDYWGKGLAKQAMLPSIGVPTTAGTGSEAQCFALISDEKTHRKMACGDLKARFHTVILDPELLHSVPREVAATTAMDAVTHALESFVTNVRNPVSQMFAREAWRLLNANFDTVLSGSGGDEAWGNMMLGAHYSGCAIENSMLGAAHACANPLTAQFDVTHGVAVGLMLPHVIRFNNCTVDELYDDLADSAKMDGPGSGAERLARRVSEMQVAAGLPTHLNHFGIEAKHLPALADDAKHQWTGNFNPRPVAEEQFQELYEAAL
ncbi:MAG: iron-containing alcohol dehydrogenase [Acidobacteriota bacterium]|nr:iron-containing alcohol dehydrogenase [Acidobacteriota bacterium]